MLEGMHLDEQHPCHLTRPGCLVLQGALPGLQRLALLQGPKWLRLLSLHFAKPLLHVPAIFTFQHEQRRRLRRLSRLAVSSNVALATATACAARPTAVSEPTAAPLSLPVGVSAVCALYLMLRQPLLSRRCIWLLPETEHESLRKVPANDYKCRQWDV